MIKYLSSIFDLFFTIRTFCYAVYTFKNKNIAGGISVLALAFSLTAIFISSIVYILK